MVALSLGGPAHADPPRFEFARRTTRDGLPSNLAYGLFQDSRGYMWIATESGVCRYDGRACRTFGLHEGLVDPVARAFTVCPAK
jgi:ligand-binding sensor domain-containing protein